MATTIDVPQLYVRQRRPAVVRMAASVVDFSRRYPLGAICFVVVIIFIMMAAMPSLFTTQSPDIGRLGNRFLGPSAGHWFGTDQQGRDLYTRVVFGARNSITIGFGVVLVSTSVACFLGIVSGYIGGWIDILIQRIVDVGIALPGLIFIILVITSAPQIPVNIRIILAVGILSAIGSSRIFRSVAITSKQQQYIDAARVVGATDWRIMLRHVLPNVIPIVLVSASIQVGGAILIESSLAFLGYGVPPPTASWGRMLNEARGQLTLYPHVAVFPGLAIFVAVYSFNMFGDALRDALDPRLRGAK